MKGVQPIRFQGRLKATRGPRAPGTSSFLSRVASGLSVFKKDFGVTAEGDTGWSRIGGGGSVRYAGSDMDWETEAGALWLNSVVSICLQFTMDKIAEPHLRAVYHGADDLLQPVVNHPAALLLAWANPEYRGRQLLAASSLSYKLNGNAYIVKVRGPGGVGSPRELWYVPHWRMIPLAPPDGGPTQFYAMSMPNGQPAKIYKRADVIHLRNGLDPSNPRLGLSSFRAQFRGVVSDNEIDTYTAVLLRNFGVVGAMVTPDGDDVEISPEQADELKRRMRESMTGDSRGDILVPNVPVKIQYASRSPQDMALGTIGDRPMQRLCATFGIDPAAVGLASLTGEKYGTLRKEARASSYEQGILPMLAVFAEGWTQELLPEFLELQKAGPAASPVFLEYDYTGVKDMQEDADATHKRARDDFKGYGLTLNEFRTQIGRKKLEDPMGDKFLFELLPAPGGDVGVPGAPGDTPPKPGDPKPGDAKPEPGDDDELPKEDDEDDD